jgi:peptide/nickel transport system ATP-binding protein
VTEAPLLSVRHLSVDFIMQDGQMGHALEDVSFDVFHGQTLGLVGESGCGKTTTLMAIMRLLPANARITTGQVLYNGQDLLSLSERQMRDFRWKEMSIVFQGAMNALNPVMRIDEQIGEAILLHHLMTRSQAARRVGELMEMVGIPRERAGQYPHEYSGGMRQRAMIALALACAPSLLFADEPTTALDVMIQAQVLELLKQIQEKLGLAIVLVTHDLGVVAEVCDSVAVMYGGKVVESGSADSIYNAPQHPYTERLLQSFPDLNRPAGSLVSIPGTPPRVTELPPGCRFEPRCNKRIEICATTAPVMLETSSGHRAACHLCQGPAARF